MRFLGLDISIAGKDKRQATGQQQRIQNLEKAALFPPDRGWTTVFDYNTGYWQQDTSIELDTVLTYSAVFACIRLIASDIGKLKLDLMAKQESGILTKTDNPAFSPVLRKPNPIQTRIKFVEHWIQSKLQYGNTYVLKYRDRRGVVVGLWVLDPSRVKPLVSDSGAVFYQLTRDALARLPEDVTVPAREIIHDVHMTPEHPLVGVTPIAACGLAAVQGLKIQQNSKNHFSNNSRPSGILTAPGAITDETAARLKTAWEANYAGDNYGKTAVLGDDLKYMPVAITASDSQLIEQLNWTGADVCRAFGVPAYKVGIGDMPTYNNIEALDQAYYSQTLQEPIECVELLLDEGLALPSGYETQFNLDGLLRMDSLTRAKINKEKITAGILAPNEARAMDNLPPAIGGETPYLQQQNYSLHALAKRDASEDPFRTTPPPSPDPVEDDPEDVDDAEAEEIGDEISKQIRSMAA